MTEFKFRNVLVTEEDQLKKWKFNRSASDEFTFKALLSPDRKEIARLVALDINGLNNQAYTPDDRYLFERDATINQAVIKGPESGWEGVDDYPLDEVKDELYKQINIWSGKFQAFLKSIKSPKRSPETSIPN